MRTKRSVIFAGVPLTPSAWLVLRAASHEASSEQATDELMEENVLCDVDDLRDGKLTAEAILASYTAMPVPYTDAERGWREYVECIRDAAFPQLRKAVGT